MKKTDEPIIVEQAFSTQLKHVWEAITVVDEMKKWFFNNIPAFEPVIGFETRFDISVKDRVFPHLWKLTEVIPMKKITYNWRYEGYSGISIVTFELIEDGDQTKLKLTSTVTENFPANIPEFSRESGINGWNYFIKDSLKKYLELKQ